MADKKSLEEISREWMFVTSEVYPDAAESFLASSVDLHSVRDGADVVLDTNALLLPYNSGAASLNKIADLFKRLAKSGHLWIPAQVAREFVQNRPRKLVDLQQGLLDKMSSLAVPGPPSYPILENCAEYLTVKSVFEKMEGLKGELRAATNSLVEVVRGWEWNDPVSEAYRKVITGSVVVECTIAQEDLRKELLRRYELAIPPGYKDSSKDDGGIGDFVIWKTMLQIGTKNRRPLIFVSGDEKADWQYSSGNVALLPRYELVTEFRRASGGQPFFILPLSRLLGLFEGESSSVEELQKAEKRTIEERAAEELAPRESMLVACPDCDTVAQVFLGLAAGSSAVPHCGGCGQRYHVNRGRDGVMVRRMNPPSFAFGSTIRAFAPEQFEVEACPSCKEACDFMLRSDPGSAKWIKCQKCNAEFPVRRQKDGTIFVSQSFEVAGPAAT